MTRAHLSPAAAPRVLHCQPPTTACIRSICHHALECSAMWRAPTGLATYGHGRRPGRLPATLKRGAARLRLCRTHARRCASRFSQFFVDQHFPERAFEQSTQKGVKDSVHSKNMSSIQLPLYNIKYEGVGMHFNRRNLAAKMQEEGCARALSHQDTRPLRAIPNPTKRMNCLQLPPPTRSGSHADTTLLSWPRQDAGHLGRGTASINPTFTLSIPMSSSRSAATRRCTTTRRLGRSASLRRTSSTPSFPASCTATKARRRYWASWPPWSTWRASAPRARYGKAARRHTSLPSLTPPASF